jgi:hypothetical protein
MSEAGSFPGVKLRINVVALIGEDKVGKFLICAAPQASVEDFASKVRSQLARSNVEAQLVRLTNASGAHLLGEDLIGDVLRDAEEVIAILAKSASNDPCERSVVQVEAGKSALQSALVEGPQVNQLPGPAELFEEDLQETRPLPALVQKSDWCVEGLTPKLREYIYTRFREADVAADPRDTYISVMMKPQARPGQASAPTPLHYNLARVDVMEFEKLCKQQVSCARLALDNFQRCQEVLNDLVDRGKAFSDYAPTLLPYKYRNGNQMWLNDVHDGSFGQTEAFRPVILIDTSGMSGKVASFLRVSLKRMLYSWITGKSKFNLVAFSMQGHAAVWGEGMISPTAEALREAEAWIDALKPVRVANMLDGIQLSLSPADVDAVYMLTAGFSKRSDVGYILRGIRSLNIREVPINVIGIDCDDKASLDLRHLAEENHGSFRNKSFAESKPSTAASKAPRWQLPDTATQMTIGGQLNIFEIMLEEKNRQLSDWLDEQKCANRLLLSTATQQAVPALEQLRLAKQHALVPGRRLEELLMLERPKSVSSEARRPSLVNPWDRPGGAIRASRLMPGGRVRSASRTRWS